MSSVPATTAGLTKSQADFVRQVARGVQPMVAAAACGYSAPETEAWRLTRLPHIAAAITAEARRVLYVESAPAALALLVRFMEDPKVENKLRIDCAKTVSSRGGFVSPKASDNNALSQKALNEMSRDELHQAMAELRRELSDRATVVLENVKETDDILE